jgi:hypothetical protein
MSLARNRPALQEQSRLGIGWDSWQPVGLPKEPPGNGTRDTQQKYGFVGKHEPN